ncbi:unnamed protein product, partial [Mesorhabditis spiculigera]
MISAVLVLLFATVTVAKYAPTWDSIDSRPLPTWYDDAKFGIFMHWGAYSVPAFREWFWWYWQGPHPDKATIEYVSKNYAPDWSYADFARDFKAELFNADEFRNIVNASGAKYFVLTSKHHEGFTMWPSKTSWNWNSVNVGPKRDIVGELKKSFAKSDIHFGLYFSLFEWFHPQYLEDVAKNTSTYVQQVSYPQLLEIVNTYEPDVIWSDGDWDMSEDYWKSKEFLAWLYNESPVKDKVVTNDRWGKGVMGKHGGFMTYQDHYDPGTLLPRKWENCLTLDKESWGNRRTMTSEDVRTAYDVIEQIARTISCGGNVLLNVGPDSHGKIPPIFEDRLREIGKFVHANKDAIYGSKPWVHQNDSGNIWYTSRLRSEATRNPLFNPQDEHDTIIYAWILDVKHPNYTLSHVRATDKTKISILSTGTVLNQSRTQEGKLTVLLDLFFVFRMLLSLLIFIYIPLILCQEAAKPKPYELMAQRFMATLPELPQVIQGQMQGNPDGLKKMVSSVLGDSLISKLALDPVGTAEGLGVSMDALGLNKTDVMAKLNNATNGLAGSFLNKDGSKAESGMGLQNLLFATTPSTTTVMYMDGRPISQDELENYIKYIAESVLSALKRNGITQTTTALPPQPSVDTLSNFDMGLVDPVRMGEVNHLLRRAPQKFDTLDSDDGQLPIAPLDPTIDSVLTTLRTKSFSGLSVGVLQNELIEQKKRIEEQRKMEEELRKKEKELEEQRMEMERQLQKQLHSWHSSFNDAPPGFEMPTLPPMMEFEDNKMPEIPPSQDIMISDDNLLPPQGLPEPTRAQMESPSPPGTEEKYFSPPKISVKPSSSRNFFPVPEIKDELPELPPQIKSPLSQLRYAPRHLDTTIDTKEITMPSNCECVTTTMEKMAGDWYTVLGSDNSARKTQSNVAKLIGKSSIQMQCQKYEIIASGADEGQVNWMFKTTTSSKLKQYAGTINSLDGIIASMNLRNRKGRETSTQFCVLKTGGNSRYEYMVTVDPEGACNEATLWVRSPEHFFDHDNFELRKYLKHKISQKEMDPMNILSFGGECR